MPRSKKTEKDGVGQLTLTFGYPKDDAQETQETRSEGASPDLRQNGPSTSIQPGVVQSKQVGKRKWHSLIDKVWSLPNLSQAWKRVQSNKGAAGTDGMTVAQFASRADERLTALSTDLRAKTYRPHPVRRVMIPKTGGGERPLGIPTVRDRIVQQALLQVLQPVFEPVFSTRSHGFRPGRGCASALSVVDRAIRHGYTHVVDADIQSFFDTVDHEKLLTAVNEEVSDGSVLRLIRHILKAGVWLPSASEVEPTVLGTPQGGPLSPLLANIYLDRLDQKLTSSGHGLVRYADDFVIFAKSEQEAGEALSLARQVLSEELGLILHPEKTRVVSVDEGFEFLGFHYFRYEKTGVRCKEVRRKSMLRFRDSVRSRTPRLKTQKPVKERHLTLRRLSKNKRLAEIIGDLNKFLRGWHWYFKTAVWRSKAGLNDYDGFVRRRLRSSVVGRTGNGWWTFKMTNRMLGQLGLTSLVELQTKYQAHLLTAPVRKN